MTISVIGSCFFVALFLQTVLCLADRGIGRVIHSPSDDDVDNQVTRKFFGHDWLDPIYTGYVFVSNRYVDAPYVFEQRGGAIYVNGLRFEYIPCELETYAAAKALDRPPPLANIASIAGVEDILTNATVRTHARHLVATSTTGDEAIRFFCEYLRRLPCVSNVVDTGIDGAVGQRDIVVTDRSGGTGVFVLSYEVSDVLFDVDPSSSWDHILPIVDILRTEGCAIAQRGCITLCWYGKSEEATNLFLTLVEDGLTRTQRFERMASAMLVDDECRNMETFGIVYPLQGVTVSDQFWQRFRGDSRWTNDAPQRLSRLTNRWVKIKPYKVPSAELTRRFAASMEKKELLEQERRTAEIKQKEQEFAEQKRRELVRRTGRIRQDSLSAMLVGVTNAVKEDILPGVVHLTIASTNHIYAIGVHRPSHTLEQLTLRGPLRQSCPEIQEVEFVHSNMVLLVYANVPLTDLPSFVNELARQGSLPYWNELEIRTKKSPYYDVGLFECVSNSPSVPSGLTRDWTILSWTNVNGKLSMATSERLSTANNVRIVTSELAATGDVVTVSVMAEAGLKQQEGIQWMRGDASSSQLSIAGRKAKVAINAVTAHCSWVNQTIVRVFDESGKYLWESPHTFANTMVYCTDLTGDGLDDIVVYSLDHGSTTFRVYKQCPRPNITTNGWQEVLPSFMRTQTVAVATIATVAKSDCDTTTATVVGQVASTQRTSYAAVSPTETVVPRDKERNWTVPVAIALTVILILLLFLTRHLFRKWNRDQSR